jgi:3-oxoacyl-[acyl-carrier protein] reductase/2-deoxy-D-gluconate 3-dehydrogenase
MNALDLSGKIILITGAAGAIGRVVARTLADHGAPVAANDVLDEATAEAALSLHDRIRYLRADTTQPAEV